jgi:microcystin-dependent protein
MAGEPTTPNTALIVPNTGDLVGTWGGTALNPDFVAIDGMLGGTQTIALTGGTTTLSFPTAGTIAAAAGPNQSQNACINLTGTLTANNIIVLTMPGRYVFHNQLYNSPYTFSVQLTSAGLGRKIGLPPGKKTTVYHDGTNVDFVDMPDPGTAYDFHGPQAPAWMAACTQLPYLIKDGTIYVMSQYPALGNLLGSTYGGNGFSTFAVPDERARIRIAFDNGGVSGRMTAPIDASVMGSAGGEQSHLLVTAEMPTHNHNVNDPTHSHNINGPVSVASGAGAGVISSSVGTIATTAAATGITLANTGGSTAHNNVQPGIVCFLPMIKT